MTACYVAAGATFTSTAALSLGQGSALYGACAVPPTPGNPAIPAGTFNNSGTVTAAGSNTYPASIGYPYNSSCMVTNDTGTINIASGTLNLGGANVALNPGAHITGVSSSTLNVGGGEVDLNSGASISGPSTVDVEGVLSLVPALSVPTLVLNGIVQGGGNVTVTAALSGTGQYSGTGTVTVTSGATLTSGSLQVNSGSLVSNGTASIPVNDSLYVGAGATFTSTAALSLGQSSVLYGACAVPPTPGNPAIPAGTFNNSGTVTAAGSNTYPASIGYPYNSYCMVTNDSGTINIASGTLNLGGSNVALNSGAQITGASSSTLNVGGGEVDLNSGASISGSSTVDVEGVLSLVPALSVPTLVLNGIVQGSGNVSVTAALSGTGQYSGTGTVTVAPGATLTSGSLQVNSGSLVNNGTGSIPAADSLYVAAGATFTSTAALSLGQSSVLYGACAVPPTPGNPAIPAGTFNNSGTVTAAGSNTYPASIGYPYNSYCMVTNDTGTINIASGTLNLGGANAALNSGSHLTGISASTLNIGGGEVDVNSGASISGPSTIDVEGTFKAAEGVSLPKVSLAGTLELGPGVVVHASSLAPSPAGTLQLDASGPGQFGQLTVGGSVDLSSVALSLNTGSYIPVCGTAMTALSAGSVASTFEAAYGPVPDTGTWQTSSTSTTAGAFIYCPPPPVPAAQTYGIGSSYDSTNPSGYYAEPVNTATGAYSTTETDATLAGIGVPFHFVRSYTSSDPYSGPLGPGWTDSMNVFLSGSPQSLVTLYSEDGQQTVFTGVGTGAYSAPSGTHSVLTDISGGGWLLVRQNQEHLIFNASGQLTSETDRNGVGLSFSYNSSGQLVSVTDFAGRTVTFSYNSSGLLSQMSFPSGRSVTYSYNGSGQLASVTDAAGGVTSYTYDPAGLLATVTDQNGHQVVANTYDSSGRVISQVNALGKTATFSWDPSTQTCTYTDPNGHQWRDVYSGDVLTQRIDPLLGTTSYVYDANMDLTAVTNPDGNTTTMSYDDNGNMLTKTAPYPISTTQTWAYDGMNDVTSYTDGNGNATSYGYDIKGNRISKTLPDRKYSEVL